MQLPVASSKTLQTTRWCCCCCHIISIVCVCDLVGSCCSSIYSYVGMCYVCCEYEQCEYSSYIIHLSSGSIKAKAIKKRKGNTSVALCCVCYAQNVSSAWLSAPVSRWQSSKLLQNVNVNVAKTKLSSYTPTTAKAAPISLSVSYFIIEVM